MAVLIMLGWYCTLTWASGKACLRLSHWHAKIAPARGVKANACGLWGRTRILTERRSGFNRYRRTWAGPKLTTELGASWRRAEAAKRDIPSHDISFSFSCTHVQESEDRIRVPPSIYTGSPREREAEGGRDKGSFARCTSHVRSNFLIVGVEYKWSLG